jgi:hypothetical protein
MMTRRWTSDTPTCAKTDVIPAACKLRLWNTSLCNTDSVYDRLHSQLETTADKMGRFYGFAFKTEAGRDYFAGWHRSFLHTKWAMLELC